MKVISLCLPPLVQEWTYLFRKKRTANRLGNIPAEHTVFVFIQDRFSFLVDLHCCTWASLVMYERPMNELFVGPRIIVGPSLQLAHEPSQQAHGRVM